MRVRVRVRAGHRKRKRWRRGDLEPGLAEPGAEGIEAAKRRFERHYLVRLLAKHSGDRAAAAEEAELHVKSLGRLLRRHGLTQREQS